jgi:hypothetical protein
VQINVQLFAPNKPAQSLYVDQRSKRIEIGRITKDMGGQYIIEATNPYGSVKDYFYLTVNEGKNKIKVEIFFLINIFGFI